MDNLIKLPKIKGLDKVTFPHVPPEINIEKYFDSKSQNTKFKKYPEWDTIFHAPSKNRVLASKEFLETQQKLFEKRTELVNKINEFQKQRNEIKQKEINLKNNFVFYNKFIQENLRKRERANARIAQELFLQEQRKNKIEEATKKIEKMIKVRDLLQEYVEKFDMYGDFLMNVVKEFKEYNCVYDILNRYDTLAFTNQDITTRHGKELSELEHAKLEMIDFVNQMNDQILELNNQIAELEENYEKNKILVLHWEIVVDRVKNTTNSELLKIGEVKQACWSLYNSLCKRNGVIPEYSQAEIDEQLTFIQKNITEFQEIMKITTDTTTQELNSLNNIPISDSKLELSAD